MFNNDHFEAWLRTVCFQKPTKEAYDLAKDAWSYATKYERNLCSCIAERVLREHASPEMGYKVAKAIRRGIQPI